MAGCKGKRWFFQQDKLFDLLLPSHQKTKQLLKGNLTDTFFS